MPGTASRLAAPLDESRPTAKARKKSSEVPALNESKDLHEQEGHPDPMLLRLVFQPRPERPLRRVEPMAVSLLHSGRTNVYDKT